MSYSESYIHTCVCVVHDKHLKYFISHFVKLFTHKNYFYPKNYSFISHISSLAKDKSEKTFAFTFMKMMKDDGSIIRDGPHDLYVYKVGVVYRVGVFTRWVCSSVYESIVCFYQIFLVEWNGNEKGWSGKTKRGGVGRRKEKGGRGKGEE